MRGPDGREVCWACGSEHLTEAESVTADRRGWTERALVCEDCGRVQFKIGEGRGLL